MADIRIHRAHALGLAKARQVAWAWAEQAEQKLGLACTVVEGDDEDVVEFTRSGASGRLVVTADAFDLTARLGLLAGAFRSRIESEIESQLDAVLGRAKAAAGAAAKRKKR